MCGILGQVKVKADVLDDPSRFRSALQKLAHRGPDDDGVVSGKNFIFGHRRLKIIDLSPLAAQPMKSDDGKVTLTFNGEIYNYQELREDLLFKGYSFKSTGDTEVLLKGYHCYGIDFIKQCNGEFAVGIFDERNGKSFLVRDRLGIKPLYYTHANGRITFSSEIKGILGFESIDRKLNLDAVSAYMTYRYPILGDTFFEGIFSLAPGHYIEIDRGQFTTHSFWDPTSKFAEQKIDRGEEYYSHELRRTLESSVRYRMISDVPVGAYLSGGVDSAIITALMAQNSSRPVETFTVGFDSEDFNEFKYARIIADRYKTNHHELLKSSDGYFEVMDRLIGFKDAPLSIPNEVPQYELSQELKKFITVVLSGNGADEILCGYGRIFRSIDDYARLKEMNSATSADRTAFLKAFESKYKTTQMDSELEHFMNIYGYTNLTTKKELLHSSIDLDGIEKKFVQLFKTCFNQIGSESYLNKMIYSFEKLHLPGILHHQDNATMATSVESRVPFIDHRFVEFAFTIPAHYKLKWNSSASPSQAALLMSDQISEVYDTPKYILKKSYAQEIDAEILYRKKMGFPVPLHRWFGGDFKNFCYCSASFVRKKNVFESSAGYQNSKRFHDQSKYFLKKTSKFISIQIFIALAWLFSIQSPSNQRVRPSVL